MGFKRKLADTLGQLTDTVILSRWETHRLPEREHLRRFFDHFAVDCVFDVGANDGQTVDKLRNFIGFRGDIISFEPIPEVAEALRRRAARDPRWHVVELALDRTPGVSQLHVTRDHSFSSLLPPLADQPQAIKEMNEVLRVVEVQRSTLADEFHRWREKLGFQRPFLKMDTQGYEVAIFEGGGDIVRHFVGLQAELSMRLLYDGSPTYAEAIEAFRKGGFELSAFVPGTAGHFPMLLEMDCIMYRPEQVSAAAE